MKEVREQLVFQDHLVAAVTDWKNQIITELQSDKNIIFIGVHCRDDSKPKYEGLTSLFLLLRRTDYKEHYKKLYHGGLVDHHHFDKAFQVYRSVYIM